MLPLEGSMLFQLYLLTDQITKGPELVTPIGIAIAAQKSPIQYHTVYVNEQPVRLI